MTETTPLDRFLADLEQAIAVRATGDGPLEKAFRRVFEKLPGQGTQPAGVAPGRRPACGQLDGCYVNLETAAPHLQSLAASFRAIEPMLRWTNRIGLAAAPSFPDSHANAMIVGPGGFVESDEAEIGVTVMAPHTVYPDHRHPPEEVYIALSGGQWRQNDGPWNEPGVGGLIYNPGNIVHSMRAGEKPFLAVWCLPLV